MDWRHWTRTGFGLVRPKKTIEHMQRHLENSMHGWDNLRFEGCNNVELNENKEMIKKLGFMKEYDSSEY